MASLPVIDNWIGGKFVPPKSGEYVAVHDPSNGLKIAQVAVSSSSDVDDAVSVARDVYPMWSRTLTMKARVAIMLQFHALVRQHSQELAQLIVQENGKNITEALADVAKGNETIEWACSLPQLAQGRVLQVSSGGVTCMDRRDPIGIVASIVPFNFPFMVPMWTIPIALVMGNVVILKPSEKVPITMHRVAELMRDAGVPDGVFQMIQGTREAVEAIINHVDVKAVTFVGSSPVAKIVATTCRSQNKRVTALGGAKNHLVALADCDVDGAAADICASFAGCAGQRCMAASCLLLVGKQDSLIEKLVDKAGQLKAGSRPGQVGPVIDEASYNKIMSYIQLAEQDGAHILLDGRDWKNDSGGHWIGPTIILHQSSNDRTMKEEVFGPVLSVFVCNSWTEAIAIENVNPFGNAASIYTTHGGSAEWFTSHFRASMLGVNIGIPVPREPFSFGGLYGTDSKFGDLDITGDGAMEFFSNRIKITTKWPLMMNMIPNTGTVMMDAYASKTDAAHFSGQM